MQVRGNRIDFMGGLEVGGAESRRNQLGWGWEETLGQITGMGREHLGDEGEPQGNGNSMGNMDAELDIFCNQARPHGEGLVHSTKPQNL